MPLTSKGEEILANMKKEYGSKKGESVLYASKNAGKITGIDAAPQASSAAWGKCFAHDCWKTMGKDSSMGSDPSSSIPAASEEEDQAGMIAGRDANPNHDPSTGEFSRGGASGPKRGGKLENVMAAWNASGRVAFHHKNKGTVSLSGGKAISEKDAIKRMEEVLGTGIVKGQDATSGPGPTDKDPDQPTGFDGKMGLDILKKGMLRL